MSRWPMLLTAAVLALHAIDTRGGDKEPAQPVRFSLSGEVRDLEGRGLTWVQVRCMDSEGHVRSTDSADDGAFAVHGLAEGRVLVTATLLGTPGPQQVRHIAAAGTDDLVLVLDRGPELRVRVEGVVFARGLGECVRLFLRDGDETLGYFAAVDGTRLAFRQVKPGTEWTLWIPWLATTGGTLFRSGESLPVGELVVKLEPGKPITGKVQIDPAQVTVHPAALGRRGATRVVASRGPVACEGHLSDEWRIEFRPLASGRWTVTVQTIDREMRWLEANSEVSAGGETTLTPVAVEMPTDFGLR